MLLVAVAVAAVVAVVTVVAVVAVVACSLLLQSVIKTSTTCVAGVVDNVAFEVTVLLMMLLIMFCGC